jgi:hypothetical protein
VFPGCPDYAAVAQAALVNLTAGDERVKRVERSTRDGYPVLTVYLSEEVNYLPAKIDSTPILVQIEESE